MWPLALLAESSSRSGSGQKSHKRFDAQRRPIRAVGTVHNSCLRFCKQASLDARSLSLLSAAITPVDASSRSCTFKSRKPSLKRSSNRLHRMCGCLLRCSAHPATWRLERRCESRPFVGPKNHMRFGVSIEKLRSTRVLHCASPETNFVLLESRLTDRGICFDASQSISSVDRCDLVAVAHDVLFCAFSLSSRARDWFWAWF